MKHIVRIARQQPWYHQPLPRCDTLTLDDEQCTFSARWEDAKTGRVKLCKTHADMADFPVRLIRPKAVTLR